MLRSNSLVRPLASLAAFLPLALLGVACSGGSTAGSSADGGNGGDGGSGSDGASGDDGSADGAVIAPDTTPPTVVSSYPAGGGTGASTSTALTATFSEAMAPATLAGATFSLAQGAVAVPGAVTYFNDTATLVPASALALGTTYTATITTAATDVAGNALAAAYTWSFTTDTTAPLGPAPVALGAAGNFAILAKSAVTNVPTSVITGDLALSPAAASYITGFSLTRAGTKWTSPQIIGSVFAADSDPPTPSDLTTAVHNMEAAYTDAAGRPTPGFLDLGAGSIGGLTLVPGLYKWTSAVTIPTDVVISGAPNDVWIFQVSGDLTMASARAMTLSSGAKARNIFWQVAGTVSLGTTSHAEGIVLSQTAIKLGTGASLNGRLLAQTAVNLAGATVTVPAQ